MKLDCIPDDRVTRGVRVCVCVYIYGRESSGIKPQYLLACVSRSPNYRRSRPCASAGPSLSC